MKAKIERALVIKAQEASGTKSKKEVVKRALELYIRLKSQKLLQ